MNFRVLRLNRTSITSCNTLEITIAFLHDPTTTNDPFSHVLYLQEELETNRNMHQYHGSSWLGRTSKSFINHHQTDHRQMDQTTTSTRRNLPKKRKRNFGPVILPCGQYYNQEVAPVNRSAQPSIKAYCRRSRHFENRWLSQ